MPAMVRFHHPAACPHGRLATERRPPGLRDRLLNRVAFLAAFLVAATLTTALIVVLVGGHHPGHGLVVRPAATASPAHGG